MGLDMYLEGRKFFWHSDKPRLEDGKPVREITIDLGYWRKHPDLHGYIVNTFADGKDECQPIALSADNLKQIIEAVRANKLPHTTGFFFGQSVHDAEEEADDLRQLEGALDWLQASDPDPLADAETTEGPFFTAVAFKVEPDAKRDTRQQATRSVVYRASW